MKFLSFLILSTILVFSCKKKNDEPIPVEPEPIAVNGSGVYDRDSNFYNSVIIKSAGEWTSSNLKTSHFSNGDTIMSGRNKDDISGEGAPAYFFYTNNDSVQSMQRYGRLYTYYVVEDPRGLCPTGWHVPTKAEWDTLMHYTWGQEVAGGHIKGTSYWQSPNTGSDNTTKLNALPAGYRTPIEEYKEIGQTAIFWTPTLDFDDKAWAFYVKYNYSTLFNAPMEKKNAYSVRCKRN